MLKRIPHLLIAILLVSSLTGLSACKKKVTEVDEPIQDSQVEDQQEVIVENPMLTVEESAVEYRERELAEGRELELDDNFEVPPGANIITKEGGRASLFWDGFLTQSMLSGTDVLLSLSQASTRYAIIDQATGTARYKLEGKGEPAQLTVQAASWATIEVSEGRAEFIVSLVPGIEPSAWVAMLDGSASITRGLEEGAESIELTKGQVTSFTESGEGLQIVSLDSMEPLTDWYDDVEANKEDAGDIFTAAYRCELTEEGQALDAPGETGEDVGEALPAGSQVAVIQRSEPGDWQHVLLPEDESGWLPSEILSCNGPVMGVSLTAPGEDEEVEEATTVPLPTRAPVLKPVVPATVAVLTPTPTWTVAPAGEASIEFWADPKEITKGECSKLRWKLSGIKAHYLDGSANVGDEGSKEVCPSKTKTYKLKVVKLDGSEVEKSAKVKVKDPKDEATPTPEATAGPTEAPTAAATPTDIELPTNTPVPDTPVPADTDTPVPTDPPPADTDTPEPTEEPTSEPDPPTDTPEPAPPLRGRGR